MPTTRKKLSLIKLADELVAGATEAGSNSGDGGGVSQSWSAWDNSAAEEPTTPTPVPELSAGSIRDFYSGANANLNGGNRNERDPFSLTEEDFDADGSSNGLPFPGEEGYDGYDQGPYYTRHQQQRQQQFPGSPSTVRSLRVALPRKRTASSAAAAAAGGGGGGGGLFVAQNQKTSATMPLPASHSHQYSMPQPHQHQQRTTTTSKTRTSSGGSTTRAGGTNPSSNRHGGNHLKNAWEDSTVASMFSDPKAVTDRDRDAKEATAAGKVPLDRLRAHQQQQQQQQQQQGDQGDRGRYHGGLRSGGPPPGHDENMPWVVSENGLLRVVPAPAKPFSGELESNSNNNSKGRKGMGIFDDQSIQHPFNDDDTETNGYREDDHRLLPFDTPTKRNGTTRRSKLPFRDTRSVASFSAGDNPLLFSPRTQSVSVSLSPEWPDPGLGVGQGVSDIEVIRKQERLARERERERRQHQQQVEVKRPPMEHEPVDLSPLEFSEPDFEDTKAAVLASSSGVDAGARVVKQEGGLERTPRARQKQREQRFEQQMGNPFSDAPLPPPPAPLGRKGNSRGVQVQGQVPAPAPLTKEHLLQLPSASSLPPPGPPSLTSRKRRLDESLLDYNDAELHAMSYSDLLNQPFDHDPQAAPIISQPPQFLPAPAPTAPLPPGKDSPLTTRLEHYLTLSSTSPELQQTFITSLTIDEWDEAGDWFLTRFSDIIMRIKQARRKKREVVARFEAEIAAREEAVRGKIEGIGRTLREMREEGMKVMRGREVDVEEEG
ncbi:uncharacterized protein CTHT_0039020 [Thermochaetoides thermophila DSM 1495]|uniref:Extracellular mutant protein 11 C-terminal domain-containing protein n=1 Tax=Chaetomium thermophilum (strain DSM 1495 / CBS 144.50 / IMI 039719) TaxID=759272 RepID=G0S3V5_CHATD|nr:hypothetical protein CTHT_0039020 [Thermochaetoides thermophila DSM 1495]EGS22017.1 hypothetical protein CTHT_0039020 [Thermochaetoides thermophila DSM 1495]